MKSKVIMHACNIVFESGDHADSSNKSCQDKKRKGTFQYHENPNPVLLRVRFINQYRYLQYH